MPDFGALRSEGALPQRRQMTGSWIVKHAWDDVERNARVYPGPGQSIIERVLFSAS
jgi:hypothetical protein